MKKLALLVFYKKSEDGKAEEAEIRFTSETEPQDKSDINKNRTKRVKVSVRIVVSIVSLIKILSAQQFDGLSFVSFLLELASRVL